MDFEAVWHQHKPFILKVMGGALVFLAVMGVRSSIANDTGTLVRTNASTESAVKDKIAQLEGAEGLEKGRAQALTDKLEPALLQALLWRPDAVYVLPEGEKSPVLFYTETLSKAVKEIERHAARWNAKIPQGADALGLPAEVGEAEVPEALARVGLIRRVLMKLLDAGVREVRSIDPDTAEYAEREADGRFLRQLPLTLVFEGHTELLAKVLGELQVEGSFLEVTGCRLSRDEEPEAPL